MATTYVLRLPRNAVIYTYSRSLYKLFETFQYNSTLHVECNLKCYMMLAGHMMVFPCEWSHSKLLHFIAICKQGKHRSDA